VGPSNARCELGGSKRKKAALVTSDDFLCSSSTMSLGPINSTISLDSPLDYICKKTRERLQRKYPQESSPDHCIDEWRGATRATLSSLFNDHESISDVALWKRLEWILLELAKEGDVS
jgi:hypothetical protein